MTTCLIDGCDQEAMDQHHRSFCKQHHDGIEQGDYKAAAEAQAERLYSAAMLRSSPDQDDDGEFGGYLHDPALRERFMRDMHSVRDDIMEDIASFQQAMLEVMKYATDDETREWLRDKRIPGLPMSIGDALGRLETNVLGEYETRQHHH